MKKLIMIAALAAGMHVTAHAQHTQMERPEHPRMTAEQRAERQTERMVKSLQLTDAQKEKLYKVNLDAAQSIRKENEERRARIKAVRDQKEQQMKAILTPGQFMKFQEQKEAYRKEMKEKRIMMRKERGSDPGPGSIRRTEEIRQVK